MAIRRHRRDLMSKLYQQKLIFSKDYDLFDESYKIGNFTLSEKYIIFWNHYKSWKINFEQEEVMNTQLTPFSLIVDKDNLDSFIRQVIVGPQPNGV